MGEIVEISDLDLQETEERRRERKGRRLGDFLREEMEGVLQRESKWRLFKERLGLMRISCCGANWSLKASSNMETREDEEEEEETRNAGQNLVDSIESDPRCMGQNSDPIQIPATTGMNLASALAAERQFRADQEWEGGGVGPTSGPTTPRVSLIRLLEETNGCDEEKEKEKNVGNDSMCCVCMTRKKGAAFIPCGHTFCRVCSREIWVNRGGCPLCKQSIVEILDIF